MEAELRHLIAEALHDGPPRRELNLAEAIRRRFLPVGGVDDLEPHPATEVRSPPALGK
jgi:hypothetical protein